MAGTFRLQAALLAAAVLALPVDGAAATPEQLEFFESRVRPVLFEKCSACHGEQVQSANLKLTTAAGFHKGGESGLVFSETDPSSSRLLAAVRYEGSLKMPPTGKLPADEIEALRRWVEWGAPWPGSETRPAAPERAAGELWTQAQVSHWAFQPIEDPEPPDVNATDWVRTPIDRFILARLEERGLAPAPAVDKLTLLRRAKFDLHGLPPTETEIEAFLADRTPHAFARLVDRLLSSPRYGEKWGRHWLDVARYADSTGLDDDIKVPYTWRYRDYVIDALNRDTPFDEFIFEQLAGDTLPPEGEEGVNRRGVIATGFLAVGTKPLVQQDKIKMKYDVVDEQIDTTAKAFMGLTMGCARCHDHKFDPISAKDYYAMASIFASIKDFESLDPSMTVSKVHLEPLVRPEVYRRYTDHGKQINNVKQSIKSITDLEMFRFIVERRGPQLAEYMLAAHEVDSAGGELETVASREHLDCETLGLWISYLRPGDDLRLHLQRWHDANEDNRVAVAREYQRKFRARGLDWISKLSSWRQQIDAWDGDGEFPEAPKLPPGEDRFFSEVALAANASDEGAAAVDGPFSVAKQALDSVLPKAAKEQVSGLRARLEQLQSTAPAKPELAYAVRESESVAQRVFLRGNHLNPGEPVPKRFPEILAGDSQEPVASGSGRPELARWLASPDHPLTSRVIANRLWHWHFGQGLVRTPNNFGLMGEQPTHPELLDHLARRLMASGWSLKALHRSIMLSSTYRMRSGISDDAWTKDPANRLWSRFNRRRLTVEELRDSLLAVDGSLDLAMGGALTESLDSYGFKNAYLHPDETVRRTVYLPIYRNRLPSLLTLFNFADPSASIAARAKTSIAPQGLYFMNSEFVHQRARALSAHLLRPDAGRDTDRIETAYRIALARAPEPQEVAETLQYIAAYPGAGETAEGRVKRWQSLCRMLLASNEFNYVN